MQMSIVPNARHTHQNVRWSCFNWLKFIDDDVGPPVVRFDLIDNNIDYQMVFFFFGSETTHSRNLCLERAKELAIKCMHGRAHYYVYCSHNWNPFFWCIKSKPSILIECKHRCDFADFLCVLSRSLTSQKKHTKCAGWNSFDNTKGNDWNAVFWNASKVLTKWMKIDHFRMLIFHRRKCVKSFASIQKARTDFFSTLKSIYPRPKIFRTKQTVTLSALWICYSY